MHFFRLQGLSSLNLSPLADQSVPVNPAAKLGWLDVVAVELLLAAEALLRIRAPGGVFVGRIGFQAPLLFSLLHLSSRSLDSPGPDLFFIAGPHASSRRCECEETKVHKRDRDMRLMILWPHRATLSIY